MALFSRIKQSRILFRLMMQFGFTIFSIYLVCTFSSIRVNAEYANSMKSTLVYEVTSVSATSTSYVIEGWAFINESQHYTSSSDIEGYMELVSSHERLRLPIVFEPYDVTYLMQMSGRRRCGDSEYFKQAAECYYEYEYVKFQSVIPFDQLKDNTTYTLQLGIHAKKTGRKHFIELFFVSNSPLITNHNGRSISIQAKIYQTYFYVNHNYVLARTSSAKGSAIHQATSSCSAAFGRDHYFEPYSQYFDIKQVRIVDHVSWYQVLTKHRLCSPSGMHYVEEGGVDETWIPSSFIEYNGSPATIEVRKNNTPPLLHITNPTVYVGDTTFRPEDYVSATDLEDGPLIPKKGVGNININRAGNYIQEFSATDSQGLRTSKIMIVRVIEKPANTPPKIKAKNRTIYQFQNFNAMDGVSANDLEDGDITHKIIVNNAIDTTLLGKQDVCYYVQDSMGLDDETCVVISVIPYPVYSATTNLRFVDPHNLFFRESIPSLWVHRQSIIESALSKRRPILQQNY